MSAVRWQLLVDELTRLGVEATVEVEPYPGGERRHVAIRAGGGFVCVQDRYVGRDTWAGFEVFYENGSTAISRSIGSGLQTPEAARMVVDALASAAHYEEVTR